MPVYEYRCGQCSHVVEFLHRSLKDPPPGACPKCGAEALERIWSVPAVHTRNASPDCGRPYGSQGCTGEGACGSCCCKGD